jgi:excisionase family DNA binding protein
MPLFISADEAATRTGITTMRLTELCESGHAPHYRLDGGPIQFRSQEIQQWVRDNLIQICEGMPMPRLVAVWIPPDGATSIASASRTSPLSLRGIDGLQAFGMPPQASGIYFLCDGEEVVYVGQSVDVYSRVLQHRRSKQFDRVFWWPVPASELDKIEGAFIRTLKPRLNGPGPLTCEATMNAVGRLCGV